MSSSRKPPDFVVVTKLIIYQDWVTRFLFFFKVVKCCKGNITCDDLDLSVADVNRDRRIDQRDCNDILRYVNGKRRYSGTGRKLSDIASGAIVAGHYIPNDGRLYKPVIYLYPTQKNGCVC